MAFLLNKKDALQHIAAIYGSPTQNGCGDNIWLEQLYNFGIENLPEQLLKNVAKAMLECEGEEVYEDKMLYSQAVSRK